MEKEKERASMAMALKLQNWLDSIFTHNAIMKVNDYHYNARYDVPVQLVTIDIFEISTGTCLEDWKEAGRLVCRRARAPPLFY